MVGDEARERSGLRVLGERLLVAMIRTGARFLRGSFTAGCVCVVRDPADRLLLVKPRYRLDWGLPGGFLRRTEQAADAIRRELNEEIGIDLKFGAPVTTYVQGHQRHIEHVFEVVLDPEQVAQVAVTSAELSGIMWYARDALPRLQPETREALERLPAAHSAR